MIRPEPGVPYEGDPEELRLISKSAAGDQDAFRQLVQQYHRLVISVAYKALGDMAMAEDVSQEVFLKIFRSLPGYRPEKPFVHWLHRITANAVTDALRRKVKMVVSLDSMEQPPPASEGDPQDVAARHALQKAVRDAIATLPEHYRDTLTLQVFHELSYDEIAKTLEIPMGTVMSRLNSAKRLLRDRLAAVGERPVADAGTNTASKGTVS
jgi:RNA polymerase sigma-70 factor (ECF subfamily)